jgi:hypothetical protein
VVSWTETVTAGMEKVPPLAVVTVNEAWVGIETDGTETTVETVAVWPLERVSVTVTVSGPEVCGAGTTVVMVSVEPLGRVSTTVTVAAGTETVPPLEVVTATVGTWMDGTETVSV